MAKKKSSASRATDSGVEYRSWLALVPESERIRIAGLLENHKIETYQDMGGFVQHIMAELVRGNITPAVSQELRYWAEVLFTVLTVEHTAKGTPADAHTDVVAALIAVARQPMPQAKYVQQERELLGVTPKVIDVSAV